MDEQKEDSSKASSASIRRKVLFAFLNILSIGSVTVILLLIQFGYIRHYRSGFYCGNPELTFKFQGDTVSGMNLFLGTFLIPFILIIVIEFVRSCYDKSTSLSEYSNYLILAMKKWYGGYLTVLLLNFLAIEVFKFTFGTPRPHFFDTCQPDMAVNCTKGHFVPNYECLNEQVPYWLKIDSYRSFLSGHASISVYAGLFSFWYIEKRGSRWCPRLLSVTIQLLVLSFSIFSSISRITDHRHHWWDVLCGSILGAALALYAISRYCDNFRFRNYKHTETMSSDIESSGFDNKNYRTY